MGKTVRFLNIFRLLVDSTFACIFADKLYKCAMKVIDLIKNSKEPVFSFEILPPLKGNSIQKVYHIIDKLRSLTLNTSTSLHITVR